MKKKRRRKWWSISDESSNCKITLLCCTRVVFIFSMRFLPLFFPLVFSCPLPLSSDISCTTQLIEFYAKFLANATRASENFEKTLPSDILPLSIPMISTDSPLRFEIINGMDYCSSEYIALFPPASYVMKCEFYRQSRGCFCEISVDEHSEFEFITISLPNLKVELADYISKLDFSRKLEVNQAETDLTPRNQSGTSSEDRFDIGVVTHAVLVILSCVSFAGNALFVVYVFWLSR
jgi:hypothetical protein